MRFPFFCALCLFCSLHAAECEFSFADSAAVISIEGRFVNREFSRIGIDLIWQKAEADTFDVTVSGRESYRYVSTPDFRYMEYRPENVRRLLAAHHLKENIGASPLKWDDLELLARFLFRCPDSLAASNVFQPTRSAAWKSVSVNSKIQPDTIEMKSYQNEIRTLTVHRWANFDGILLPTSIDIAGKNYSGSLWIRTARRQESFSPRQKSSTSPFFQKLTESGLKEEAEVPFVLQVH